MMNVLVTGGCGYIGSVVVHQLATQEHVRNIRILDNFTTGKWFPPTSLGDTNIELIKGDIRNQEDLDHALQGVDTVCHLAGIVGENACDKDPKLTIDVNVQPTYLLADACRRAEVSRLIFASTCSVYGVQDPDVVADEDSPVNPVSLYGRTKIEAENYLRKAQSENGLDVTVLRLSTVYGYSPSIRFDLFLNLFVREAVQHRPINVFGGEKWRPVLYTIDAARAFALAGMRCGNGGGIRILNVGTESENYQIMYIANTVAQLLPNTRVVEGPPSSDKRSYRVSFMRIKEELGFEPHFSLQKGIEHLAKSLQDEAKPIVKIPP